MATKRRLGTIRPNVGDLDDGKTVARGMRNSGISGLRSRRGRIDVK